MDNLLINLFETAIELSELLYSHYEKRIATSILRLHNVSFIHGMLCVQVFGLPRTMTSRKFFGRYFHSLIVHTPITYRIVSLLSINTEAQEQMFQSAKGITRTTSNKHPEHIVTNILQRVQEECNHRNISNTIEKQESEVTKLASTLAPKSNTTLSKKWTEQHSSHFQAHLERISDYLILGKGVWWKENKSSITFYDVDQSQKPGPQVQHFRNTDMLQVRESLLTLWQECCDQQVELPSRRITQYTSEV